MVLYIQFGTSRNPAVMSPKVACLYDISMRAHRLKSKAMLWMLPDMNAKAAAYVAVSRVRAMTDLWWIIEPSLAFFVPRWLCSVRSMCHVVLRGHVSCVSGCTFVSIPDVTCNLCL